MSVSVINVSEKVFLKLCRCVCDRTWCPVVENAQGVLARDDALWNADLVDMHVTKADAYSACFKNS